MHWILALCILPPCNGRYQSRMTMKKQNRIMTAILGAVMGGGIGLLVAWKMRMDGTMPMTIACVMAIVGFLFGLFFKIRLA